MSIKRNIFGKIPLLTAMYRITCDRRQWFAAGKKWMNVSPCQRVLNMRKSFAQDINQRQMLFKNYTIPKVNNVNNPMKFGQFDRAKYERAVEAYQTLPKIRAQTNSFPEYHYAKFEKVPWKKSSDHSEMLPMDKKRTKDKKITFPDLRKEAKLQGKKNKSKASEEDNISGFDKGMGVKSQYHYERGSKTDEDPFVRSDELHKEVSKSKPTREGAVCKVHRNTKEAKEQMENAPTFTTTPKYSPKGIKNWYMQKIKSSKKTTKT